MDGKIEISQQTKRISYKTSNGYVFIQGKQDTETSNNNCFETDYSDTIIDDFCCAIGILEIKKNEETNWYFSYVSRCNFVGKFNEINIYKINKIKFYALKKLGRKEKNENFSDEDLSNENLRMAGFVQTHNFYFMKNSDLEKNTFVSDFLENEKFIWNSIMKKRFLKISEENLEIQLFFEGSNTKSGDYNDLGIGIMVCGFFNIKYVPLKEYKKEKELNFNSKEIQINSKDSLKTLNLFEENILIQENETFKEERHIYSDKFEIQLLSLISSAKVGPRLYCRGLDDNGNVSFFVKTLCRIYLKENIIFEITLIRGSIPLFWYQEKNPLKFEFKFSRESEISKNAFKRHFDHLKTKYGKIHVWNLLGKKRGETKLSGMYEECLLNQNIPFTSFDINNYTGNFRLLKKIFMEKLVRIEDKNVIFRVSCVDCLDRTNLAQYLICEYFFYQILEKYDLNYKIIENVKLNLKTIWVENGHILSYFYSGSDAMRSELALKEKRSFVGMIDDFIISASRIINSGFSDKMKYELINLLLEKNNEEPTIFSEEFKTEKNESPNIFETNLILEEENFKLEKDFTVLDIKNKFENMSLEKCDNNFLVLCCNLNHIPYKSSYSFDLNIPENTNIIIICLQKMYFNVSKMFFKDKSIERLKWKNFLESKFLENNFILAFQNFSYELATLVFIKNDKIDEISSISNKKEKIKFEASTSNTLITSTFIFQNKTFVIINCDFKLNKLDFDKKNLFYLFLNDLQYKYKNKNLLFLGNIDTPIILSRKTIQELIQDNKFKKILSRNYLSIILKNFDDLKEHEITFQPKETLKNGVPCYSYFNRILFLGNFISREYNYIFTNESGYDCIFGFFSII
ncbi:phosphoinositide polyphosphatase [Hamiltosporidium magnivora]|uniref:phosphoinositide 5-phosphatase n=3 Tax=Hamiltosporidium TaxID=1176354 RepID=A0A4Q9LMG4_9MICR|nr:phosphoinositide polyphosphatase [Hamiltosporidium magnivora]